MKCASTSLCLILCGLVAVQGEIPEEPIEIGFEPQVFVDDWLVDNRFAIKYKTNAVVRQLHPPVKHESNPLITTDGGYCNAVFDEEAGKFRMWWQTHSWEDKLEGGKTKYAIAYAESDDGLDWQLPELGLFEWKGTKDNNVVWRGPKGARASGPQILLTLPESEKRGYRFIMQYRTGGAGKENDGIRLIGSNDGVHWDAESDTRLLHIHSDTLNSIVYDPRRDEYVMSCRAKDRYRLFTGDIIETGASRRVARLANDELWAEWTGSPQQLLIPDELDAETHHNFFYGMPMHHYAGVYWGFLWVFRMNDPIHTELVTSRDGIHWTRLPNREPLIELGEDGAWDDGMNFGGPHWVERGDEWLHYYAGWDGGHNTKERKSGIGLAIGRKEGLISLRGPENGGGVVITRQIVWPGGDLFLNLDANAGKAAVRISGDRRAPVPGFDYEDCVNLDEEDGTRVKVTWNGKSLDSLTGTIIRIEIFLENADLFALQAAKEA